MELFQPVEMATVHHQKFANVIVITCLCIIKFSTGDIHIYIYIILPFMMQHRHHLSVSFIKIYKCIN